MRFLIVPAFLLVGCVDSSLDYKNQNLVMVSVSKYTEIGQELARHPSVLRILPSEGSYYQKLVMAPASDKERDHIAKLAHQDIGACGAMVPLSLGGQLTDPGPAPSPIWSTAIVSASVASNLTLIDAAQIKNTVATLESIGTRYHSGAHKADATAAVKSSWASVLPTGATISEATHTGTTQNSVIVTLPGTTADNETVIIGAHLDSINRSDEENAPGADDDASGIATIAEILRVIKVSGWTFTRRIEFHGYAAEEVGLIGSQEIASRYAAAGRKVVGMMQLDMNGYALAPNAGKIWLVTNDTSSPLRLQLKELLGAYLGGGFGEMSLSAGTSDHHSWTGAGFHAVFPFEHPQDYNHLLHTTGDKSSVLDFGLSARFGKLGLAWLAHHAGVNGLDLEFTGASNRLRTSADELKLALLPKAAGAYRLAITAPVGAVSASSCVITGATSGGCSEDPFSYTLDHQSSDKSFLITTADISPADGKLHRFSVYDANGLTIGQRIAKIKKK